ncbi:hypothetical protein GCM10027340_24180 [Marinomonas epiphytica]
MLISTLGIWALNLTAPSSKLPTPVIEQWRTSNDIPVTWLNLTEWEHSNRLELKLVFSAPLDNPLLTQHTLAMLMSDALPLSTSTINQRFRPLAAKAHASFNREQQVIGLTLSNEPQYLTPTWQVLEQWLTQPTFKQRTFAQQTNRATASLSSQYQLQQALFNDPPFTIHDAVSLEQIQKAYQQLQSHLSHIVLVGYLPADIESDIKLKLNALSRHFSLPVADQADSALAARKVQKHGTGELWQSHSALAITPIQKVEDWISLQLWGGDLVQQLNQQDTISFTQLNLALAAKQPWVWWNIQYQPPVLVAQDSTEQHNLNAESFAKTDSIPSANQQERFNALFSSFKEQLEGQALTPAWWSQIATQVIALNATFDLNAFAQSYKNSIDEFNREAYQSSLAELLQGSNYQEIQVYQ